MFKRKSKLKPENIIVKTVTFKTTDPEIKLSFRQWKRALNVSESTQVLGNMYELKKHNPRLLEQFNANFGPYAQLLRTQIRL